MQPPLKPGELPSITDTDPPPLHPATVVGDGYVSIDATKLETHETHHERHEPAGRGTTTHTTVTVSRTTSH